MAASESATRPSGPTALVVALLALLGIQVYWGDSSVPAKSESKSAEVQAAPKGGENRDSLAAREPEEIPHYLQPNRDFWETGLEKAPSKAEALPEIQGW